MKLKEALAKKLTKKQLALVPSAYDIVGDIVIFSEFSSELLKKEKIIGETLLKLHKNIKVVAKKTKKYSGKFRTPKLKIIAGEKRKETIYKENNIRLKLDVEKVYFSARLSTERKRIFQTIKDNESILVMFSGSGIYPIVISKNTSAKEIYGIEINPLGHKYASENIILNKIKNVKLFNGDVNDVLPKIKKKFDRILMPLPKGADDYLALALKSAKKGTIFHFYDFSSQEDVEEVTGKIKKILGKRKYALLDIVKCGQFSPRVNRICVDFEILS